MRTIAGAARRLLAPGLTLLWVFALCFALLHAMPGDPADRIDAPGVPPDQAERNRRALGLDEPIPLQFVRTVASYARGDLGVSSARRRPVATVLAEALPFTAGLGAAALALAYGAGIGLAMVLVRLTPRPRRTADRAMLVASAVPRFWLAVMIVLLLHGVMGWFPASHAFSPGGGGPADLLRHLALPAISLGLPAAFVVARYWLAAMERELVSPHVRAARAAGASGGRLIVRHVLRPSAGTAAALFGLDVPVLVSGAVVIEVVFAWPGLGRLTVEAVLGADYPLALALALLAASAVLAGRGIGQGLARALDPRRADAGEAVRE